jgi:hypothetical protein
LSPSRVKNFLFSTSSRPALGSTQPPIQRVSGAFSPGLKRPRHDADHSSSTMQRSRGVELYIYSSVYLRGGIVNHLSTGQFYLLPLQICSSRNTHKLITRSINLLYEPFTSLLISSKNCVISRSQRVTIKCIKYLTVI